jgi:hypothetical protein
MVASLFCDPKRSENFHQSVDVWGEMGAEQGELYRLKDPRYRDKRRKRSKAEGTCTVLMLNANQGRFWLRKSKAKNKKVQGRSDTGSSHLGLPHRQRFAAP